MGKEVGVDVGESVGLAVGDTDGAPVVGDSEGLAVGRSVLSQQLKNVTPSAAGQHCCPG